MEFKAVYYDGKTSARSDVLVRGYTGFIQIVGAELRREVPLDHIVPEPPIGVTSRVLRLPEGAQLRTDDAAAVQALFSRAHRVEGWVHRLERRWAYALACVVVVAAGAWWVAVYGLPMAAKLAAALVPPAIEAALGEQTLVAVDRSVCSATRLPLARQEAMRRRFATLTAGLGDGYAYRLALRHCRIGANAFALPGGTIVMTDDFVTLPTDDDQLSAALAHEIGHVRHRHGLRLGLQAAGVAALAAALFGDVATITGFALTLPMAILQNGYSRDLESEADAYAFARLKEVGLSPRSFAEMMEIFEKERGKHPGGNSMDYLSTHPASAKRIERALEAAGR